MNTLIASLLTLILVLISQDANATNGELLLFHSGTDHSVTQDFLVNYAPRIEEMAKSQDIEVRRIDVSRGTTDMVYFTPAIVFQNYLGRSLYLGRYHCIDKIKTFIRTVRRLPHKDVVNRKDDVMVWGNEYAKIICPLKVTQLAGVLPDRFDRRAFKEKALAAIAEGTKNYEFLKHCDARRGDRLMYAALYPYCSRDGKLYISLEIYSQFNCVIPVYKQFEDPISGSFNSLEKVFQKAGALIEEQILEQLESTEYGDGLLPIASSTPVKSFDELGYPLPPAPHRENKTTVSPNLTIPRKWIVEGPVGEAIPLINFNFPAPLESYTGEIKKMEGTLELGPGATISKSLASFSAVLESMTMGDKSLDEHVAGMISLVEYPKSSFSFIEVEVIDQPTLSFGSLTQILVRGTLDFKGLKALVSVTSQIEPILNEVGEPRLQVYAFFKMPLKEKWNVEGPEGPESASNFLDFHLNFLLKPSARGRH